MQPSGTELTMALLRMRSQHPPVTVKAAALELGITERDAYRRLKDVREQLGKEAWSTWTLWDATHKEHPDPPEKIQRITRSDVRWNNVSADIAWMIWQARPDLDDRITALLVGFYMPWVPHVVSDVQIRRVVLDIALTTSPWASKINRDWFFARVLDEFGPTNLKEMSINEFAVNIALWTSAEMGFADAPTPEAASFSDLAYQENPGYGVLLAEFEEQKENGVSIEGRWVP